jgi:hypothetical protein
MRRNLGLSISSRVLTVLTTFGDLRGELGVGIEYFLLVNRVCVVEDYVTDHHQQLFASASEAAGQRLLPYHIHQSLAHPRPELFLGSPKLIVVGAHDARGFLLLSLGGCCVHKITYLRLP